MRPFEKPLPGIPACKKCGSAIKLIVEGRYSCGHCGYEHLYRGLKATRCLCWVNKHDCPVHGGRR